ncbi:hypothetical protein AAMO2058_000926300 [Amorphochlora amoebiformis]
MRYVESKYVACVYDNASNMSAAMKKVKTKYPKIFGFGCASPILDLLYEDLVKASRVFHCFPQFCMTRVLLSNLTKNDFLEKWILVTSGFNPKPPIPRNFPGTKFGYACLVLSTVYKNRATLEKITCLPNVKDRKPAEWFTFHADIKQNPNCRPSSFVRFCIVVDSMIPQYNFCNCISVPELAEAHGKGHRVHRRGFLQDFIRWSIFGALTKDFTIWSLNNPDLGDAATAPLGHIRLRSFGQGNKIGLYRPVHLVAT